MTIALLILVPLAFICGDRWRLARENHVHRVAVLEMRRQHSVRCIRLVHQTVALANRSLSPRFAGAMRAIERLRGVALP